MDNYEVNKIEDLLCSNTYPGRGIIIGKSPTSNCAVFAYFIMGRSENSRNRVFVEKGDEVTIYPFDESKVSDPSLIIYSPVKKVWDKWIMTNGDQTQTIYDALIAGNSFENALTMRTFEPDAPNFTPRISGLLDLTDGGFSYKLNILKSADKKGSACNRYNFSYEPISGVGHFIHTYHSDGNPVPTFLGEPERVEIKGSLDEMTSAVWDSLNADNKVSLYVAYINLKTGEKKSKLINKNTK